MSLRDACPGVGLLDHMLVLVVTFLGPCILFSTAAVPFCSLICNVQRFQFLHLFCFACCLLGFFDKNHPKRCEVIAHCGFDLHFSDD